MFNVYIRSISSYVTDTDNEECKKKGYSNLNVYKPIGFFETDDLAQQFLLKMGKKISDDFFELHDQPCVFTILEQHTYTDEDNIEDYFVGDLQWVNYTVPTYMFSEEALNMILYECKIIMKYDWMEPNYLALLRYVKNGKYVRTPNIEKLFKDELKNYDSNDKIQSMQKELDNDMIAYHALCNDI